MAAAGVDRVETIQRPGLSAGEIPSPRGGATRERVAAVVLEHDPEQLQTFRTKIMLKIQDVRALPDST
jgi:hypothetical protein